MAFETVLPKLFKPTDGSRLKLVRLNAEEMEVSHEPIEWIGDPSDFKWRDEKGGEHHVRLREISEDSEDAIQAVSSELGHIRIERLYDSSREAPPRQDGSGFLTTYWTNETWEENRRLSEGEVFRHAASTSLIAKGIAPGKRLYAVTVLQGKLFVAGRMTVSQVLNDADARQLLGNDLWEAEEHYVARPEDATRLTFDREVPLAVTKRLEFFSGDDGVKRLKFKRAGYLDEQTLRAPRELTPESAAMLEAVLAGSERPVIGSLKAAFLRLFPQGFDDPAYFSSEREYKLKAAKLLATTLNAETLESLVQADDYAGIAKRALAVMKNLIYPNEKMALSDGIFKRAGAKPFAEALIDLLHGSGEFRTRFERFAATLESIGAAKWTIATYFPFLAFPTEHMFLKPEATKAIAEACNFDLTYDAKLNWGTYESLLSFAAVLNTAIADLKPKDMIDLQGFIWCVYKRI